MKITDKWEGPFWVKEIFNGGVNVEIVNVANPTRVEVRHRLQVTKDKGTLTEEEKKEFFRAWKAVDEYMKKRLRAAKKEIMADMEWEDVPEEMRKEFGEEGKEMDEDEVAVLPKAEYVVEEVLDVAKRRVPGSPHLFSLQALVKYAGYDRPAWTDAELLKLDANEAYQRWWSRSSCGSLIETPAR